MAITKQKKVELLQQLKDILSNTSSFVFVHFKGMNTKDMNDVRESLKKEGVQYTVVKKTLLKRTLGDVGVEGEMPELGGEVAIAYLPTSAGDDMSAPARSLNEFVTKFKDKLAFLGGVIEKKYLSQAETQVYASIPPTPVLRGMFVNIVNSPIQRFVIALNQIAEKKA